MRRACFGFGNTYSARKSFAAIVFFTLCVTVFGLLPYSLQVVNSQGRSDLGQRPGRSLSIDERVAYQRAIEEVYWRHTIWPAQNTQPKPGLDEVASLEATREKVLDSLRKADALARLWKRPITPAQLQSEVARMARETRRPEVLRELWAALDNDPFVIAEVLGRPILVERLARSYYSSDDNLHGALRAKAEARLRAHGTLDTLRQGAGGTFSQSEVVKVARKAPRVVGHGDVVSASKGAALELTANEWEAETARIREMFGVEPCESCSGGGDASALPVGSVSSLQEDENSFYVTSVVASTGKRLKVARVEWAKTSFDAWWPGASANFAADASAEGFDYQLAEINQPSADDTWTPTKALPEATGTAVWTGAEMIVWGGGKQNSGARYNPTIDTWTPTSVTNVPSHRSGHTAVWTGTEMIVWGGCGRHFDFCGMNDGGRYNPVSDTWVGMSVTNAPAPRSRHVAVWTGSKMIIWAGIRHDYRNSGRAISSGGVYDLAGNSWTTMNTTNAPQEGGSGFTAVWTGAEMIAWGGNTSFGGRYNPETNAWRPTNPLNAPSPRTDHTAVWTGTEMIIWGGTSGSESLNTGGRYNPASDSWTPTSTTNAPNPRHLHTAVWTGTEMIVWGGNNPLPTNTGGRYNPSTDSWTETNTANAPPPKSGHVAVWTGELMIVWSVTENKTGGRYNPANDSWTPTDNNDSPPPISFGVWSGTEMIVWSQTASCPSGCHE
jgi:N-acetylneuraminic acid mutarotase